MSWGLRVLVLVVELVIASLSSLRRCLCLHHYRPPRWNVPSLSSLLRVWEGSVEGRWKTEGRKRATTNVAARFRDAPAGHPLPECPFTPSAPIRILPSANLPTSFGLPLHVDVDVDVGVVVTIVRRRHRCRCCRNDCCYVSSSPLPLPSAYNYTFRQIAHIP